MTLARRFYDSLDRVRWGRNESPEAERVTAGWVQRETITGPSLELGCGVGLLAGAAPGYVGVDLAYGALRLATGRMVQASMEELPFRDGSFRFLFSWAAIEHVPHPELVMREIERVLGPRGVAILAPAWHCRPWAAEGLEFRSYRELSATQRIRKALIPLRNALAWRAMFEAPRRISREVRALRRLPEFEYERLEPDLVQYRGTDSDAFTSMDPHATILYFARRRWEVLSHPTIRSRMLARSEPVVVRKPPET